MTRTFRSAPAVRANVPLLLALIGPSGGGKTFSAHRLARGIQRVQPGKIFGVDTERKRMCELADRFSFEHVDFEPPYGSLDYRDCIQHCVERGARTVIIDSMSHEHEGVGGCLDAHQTELARRMANRHPDLVDGTAAYDKQADKLSQSCWIKPKADRKKLINYIVTEVPCNVIMCFRAQEKNKIGGGKLIPQGWMPIGPESFWFEMTARFLLLPGANGVPTWRSEFEGEKIAMRLPEQFQGFARGQLTEDVGEKMARWATGSAVGDMTETIAQLESAEDLEALRRIVAGTRNMQWTDEQRVTIKKTLDARQSALKSGVVPGAVEEKKDGIEKQQ